MVATAATLGLAISGLLAGAGSAAAGSNGQKLLFHNWNPSNGPAVYSVQVSGYNEQGNWVQHCFQTNGNEWTNFDGWWWVGNISYATYYNYNCTGAMMGNYTVDVPKDQGRNGSDWVVIMG